MESTDNFWNAQKVCELNKNMLQKTMQNADFVRHLRSY